jgi:hypothetical protein
MNNAIAEWSQPWHELQRNLAAGFGVHAGAHAANGWQSKRGAPEVRCLPGSASPISWLIRARTRVLPVRGRT